MTSYCSAQRISLILAIIGALAIIAGITLLILEIAPVGIIILITGFLMCPIAYMEWSCRRRDPVSRAKTVIVEPPPISITVQEPQKQLAP